MRTNDGYLKESNCHADKQRASWASSFQGKIDVGLDVILYKGFLERNLKPRNRNFENGMVLVGKS